MTFYVVSGKLDSEFNKFNIHFKSKSVVISELESQIILTFFEFLNFPLCAHKHVKDIESAAI